MILFGFSCAVAAGAALPGHTLLFGRIINSFIFYSAATNCTVGDDGIVIPSLSMVARNVLSPMPMDKFTTCDFDDSCSDAYFTFCSEFLQNNSQAIFTRIRQGNASRLLCDTDTIFESVLEYVCCPGPTLRDNIRDLSFIHIGMATGVLIVVFLATMFWNISAYRQTRQIRQAFYCSVLYQNVGWFDVTEPSQLSTRLAEYVRTHETL